MTTMRLTVNGDTRDIPGPASLDDLLRHLDVDARMVVVELNRRIVRRPELASTPVQDGDAVELVQFVGGG